MSRMKWLWARGAAWKGFVGLALGIVVMAAGAALPPGTFEADNKTVTIDNQPVGEGGPLGTKRLRNTIVYHQGRFHMWYATGDYLEDIAYATSEDGIAFTSSGQKLSPPSGWWEGEWHGKTAASEPIANFLRAVRVGGDWMLMVWHPHVPARKPYSYNTSLWHIGPDPAETAIQFKGPLPASDSNPKGPGGRHIGAAGLIDGHVYLIQQHTASSFGRYALDWSNMTTNPTTEDSRGDLYTRTGWCANYLNPDCANINPEAANAYLHNKARVLQNGDGLILVYSLRQLAGGAPVGHQLFYVESNDNGETWTQAQTIFPSKTSFTIDERAPTAYGFSSPELVDLGGGVFRGYFDAEDTDGRYVMVTSARPTPPPAPAQISPVPVMSPWGLALLIALAGGGAGLGLRRRRDL